MSTSDGVARHCCSFQLLRCQVVEVLPRVYPLVLGELEPRPPAAKTQGKAGNQLAALRLSTSSVSKKVLSRQMCTVEALDCNLLLGNVKHQRSAGNSQKQTCLLH